MTGLGLCFVFGWGWVSESGLKLKLGLEWESEEESWSGMLLALWFGFEWGFDWLEIVLERGQKLGQCLEFGIWLK